MTYNKDRDLKNLRAIKLWKLDAPDYAKSFINMKSNTASVNTLRIYINNLNIFWRWLEKQGISNSLSNVCSVTVEQCQRFISDVSTESAVSTILSLTSTLSSLYDHLITNGYIIDNPFSHIERPKLQKTEPFRLTNDEKCALMHVINTGENMSKRFIAQELSHGTRFRNQAIVKILIETGIKVSELVSLNVDDVNFLERTLSIENNGNIKTVTISQDTASTIKDCIDMRYLLSIPSDEKALFIASQGKNKNKRISTQTVDGLIKKYAVAANIKNADKLSPNKFRQMNFLEVN